MLVPELVIETLSFVLVKVQFPVDGKSVKVTEPVESVHEGWTSVPTTGADWTGIASMVTKFVTAESQIPLETENV